MRIRPAVWLMVALILTLALTLYGCREAAQDSAVQNDADAHEHAEAEAQESATEGQVTEESVEPLTAEEAEAALNITIDPDRAYPQTSFDHLRNVLWTGSEQYKAQAVDVLVALLQQSRNVDTRRMAADTLSAAADRAVGPLTTAALNDSDKWVRKAAIDSLAKASPSDEVLAALQQAEAAPDPDVRYSALLAEMDQRMNMSLAPETWEWIARLLARQRDDASAQLQIKLVSRAEPVLPVVMRVLEQAPDENARAAAACVIMCICAGTSPKQQEFAELSQAIMKEGIPEPKPANLDGVAPLETALAGDPSWRVRAIAAQGLGYLGQDSSARLLGEALSDPNEEVRWWAALALETVPSEGSVAALASAANRDASTRVRAAAVRSLGWTGSERAVLPLIRATADRSSAVRQAAAEELGRFEDPASLEALLQLFNDTSEDVRWAAVVAAGNLRDEESVPALVEAMRDRSPMVANAAERALQRMGRAEQRFGTRGEEM